jgi:hypothetical protein
MPDKPQGRGLAFQCTRRNFWPALLQEITVIRDAVKGTPGFKLSELRDLPDEQLAQMRPVANPDYQILIQQDYVCCRHNDMESVRQLFAMTPENLAVWNQFNGQHRLDEIGARLAEQMDWEPELGFVYAKEFFLALAERLACLPQDELDPAT